RTGRPTKYANTFLLHGLLKCGVCENTIVAYRANNTHKHKRYYKCRWNKAGAKEREINGVERCILPMIPAEALEDWVWTCLTAKLRGHDKNYAPLFENNRFETQITTQETKIENIAKTIAQKQ